MSKIDEIIKLLADKPCLTEIEHSDWRQFGTLFHESDEPERMRLLKVLSSHSGVLDHKIHTLFHCFNSGDLTLIEQHLFQVQNDQSSTTIKIAEFQQHHNRNKNFDSLNLSRTEWLAIISRFEKQHGHNLTIHFLIRTLSAIRKKSYNATAAELISKEQPERKVKKRIKTEQGAASKKIRRYVLEDDGHNPLIMDSNSNPDLLAKAQETGVRTTPLIPATPEKGYDRMTKKTPGGRKARPLCCIDGITFFKHASPYRTQFSRNGRVELSQVSEQQIRDTLPRLLFEKAEPVVYIATLAAIAERSGMAREQSQISQMKASASNVFRAHGIEITPEEGRYHHWAHLIAHFLGDPQDIMSSNPENAIVNLVPSTSAANYNTLEAIELFIREQLINLKTDKIRIEVNPRYSGENFIPDLLIYSLSWIETKKDGTSLPCNEVFYICPQSYYRFTRSIHESINLARSFRETQVPDSSDSYADESASSSVYTLQ